MYRKILPDYCWPEIELLANYLCHDDRLTGLCSQVVSNLGSRLAQIRLLFLNLQLNSTQGRPYLLVNDLLPGYSLVVLTGNIPAGTRNLLSDLEQVWVAHQDLAPLINEVLYQSINTYLTQTQHHYLYGNFGDMILCLCRNEHLEQVADTFFEDDLY